MEFINIVLHKWAIVKLMKFTSVQYVAGCVGSMIDFSCVNFPSVKLATGRYICIIIIVICSVVVRECSACQVVITFLFTGPISEFVTFG